MSASIRGDTLTLAPKGDRALLVKDPFDGSAGDENDIPELIRADEADEVVLVRHYQRTIHGIHPFDGSLHRPAAIQHAGCRIDLIDALRRYGGLRKGGEILYFCKEVEVGHAIAPPNGLRFAFHGLTGNIAHVFPP